MPDAINEMARAFARLSEGKVEMPVRGLLRSGPGHSLLMPARISGGGVRKGVRGVKVVGHFPGNAARGIPTIHGALLMVDDETGRPVALMEAAEITAIRTGAAAGLAAKLLSPADASVLAIFGAGAQAPRQIEAIRCVRSIREVRVVSKSGVSAERLAASLTGVRAHAFRDSQSAIDGADIVVAVTPSTTPVFDGSALTKGAHVSGSGSFTPQMQEIGPEVVARARVVVEHRASAMEEAGDLIVPIRQGRVPESVIDAELGEIVLGKAPTGARGRDLTFFKSVGTAVQDVALGFLVLEKAVARNAGVNVELV